MAVVVEVLVIVFYLLLPHFGYSFSIINFHGNNWFCYQQLRCLFNLHSLLLIKLKHCKTKIYRLRLHAHIDYSSFFHPLLSQTRLVAGSNLNVACNPSFHILINSFRL